MDKKWIVFFGIILLIIFITIIHIIIVKVHKRMQINRNLIINIIIIKIELKIIIYYI